MSVALHVTESPSRKVRCCCCFDSAHDSRRRRRPANRNTLALVPAAGAGESSDSLDEPDDMSCRVGVSGTTSCGEHVERRANELARRSASSILRSSAADNCRIPQTPRPPLALDDDDNVGIIWTDTQTHNVP